VLRATIETTETFGGFMAIPGASRDRLLNKQQLKTKRRRRSIGLQFHIDSNPAKTGQSSGLASRAIVAVMSDIRPVAPVNRQSAAPLDVAAGHIAGILTRV
jgi:hypothetical protein